MKTDFAAILSSLRREHSLSQKKAADDLGISQALLSHYENGVREPKLEFILKACDYYSVSADYILGRTTDKATDGKREFSFSTVEERRCADAGALIVSVLSDIDDAQLRDAASRYFYYCLYTMLSAFRTPMKPYEPLFDAALKAAEACFVANVRRVNEKAGQLPNLSDDALQTKYPSLCKAVLEIDEIVGNAVKGICELNNANR